jgi:hypothetical protein
LLGACEKLTLQVWYNHKVAAASQFWAERGKRIKKEDIVGRNPNPDFEMSLDDFMSVSEMLMRSYIAAKLPLHYLVLSIAFFRLSLNGLSRIERHGRSWLVRGGSGQTGSLQPCRCGTRKTEAMVEHTARETAALIASRGRWYVHTWNDLHLFSHHVPTLYA